MSLYRNDIIVNLIYMQKCPNEVQVLDVTHEPLVVIDRAFDTFKYPFHTCACCCKMIYNEQQGFPRLALYSTCTFNKLTHLLLVFIEFKNRIQKMYDNVYRI